MKASFQRADVLSPLYAIVDVGAAAAPGHMDPLEQTVALLAAGVELIQLRAKHLTVSETHALAKAMSAIIKAAGARFAINDRPDIAKAVQADMLHLGQDDLSPTAARRLFNGAIGLSTHTIAQVRRAMDEPVDYIGFGPVFSTCTKVNPDPVTGLQGLEQAVRSSEVPVVGIGGIGLMQVEAVLATGAASVAVIAALQAGTRDEVIAKAELLQDRCEHGVARQRGASSL